tara:strand:+ start:205 stop:786 length:582 start_codon:yes stop_codon:yes gene_type:complete
MLSEVLLGSCSSKKVLSERLKHDWNINYLENEDVNNSFTTIEDYQYVNEHPNNILNNELENENLIASTKKVFVNNKKHLVSLSKKVDDLIATDGDCDNIIYKNGEEVSAKVIDKSKLKSQGLSLTSMIFGLVGLVVPNYFVALILESLAIIFSIIAMVKIKKNPEKFKGKGFAITGLVLGILCWSLFLLEELW